jgi:modulator of FtsH protease HflC
MKVKTLIFIVAAFVLALIIIKSFLFVVDETEQAVVLRFGEPVRVILGTQSKSIEKELIAKYTAKNIAVDTSGPGLKWKLPFVQQVTLLDDRLLDYDDDPQPAPTKEKKYITIDNYTRWAIIDPLEFIKAVRTEGGAQKKLDDVIYPTLRQQVASNYLYEVVRTTNREIVVSGDQIGDIVIPDKIIKGREKIIREITRRSDKDMQDFGIKVVDVRMKRVDLSTAIKRDVEQRMISERRRVELKYKSEGDKYIEVVEGTIKQRVNAITSKAERLASAIEGQADGEAIKIYAEAYSRDPEFFNFLRTLESYKKSIGKKTRFIVSTDSDYFKLLKTLGVE